MRRLRKIIVGLLALSTIALSVSAVLVFGFGLVAWATDSRLADRNGYTLIDGDIVFTLVATGFLGVTALVLGFLTSWLEKGEPPVPLSTMALGLVGTIVLGVPAVDSFNEWTNGGPLGNAVISNDIDMVTEALNDHRFDQDELDLWLGRSLNKNRIDMAEAIIAAGGDVHHLFAADDTGTVGHSLLYRGVRSHEIETIRFVAGYGVDPNVAVATGATPLHELVRSRATANPSGLDSVELQAEIEEIARLLVEVGADPLIETQTGENVPCLLQRLDQIELLAAMSWVCE